MDNKIPPGSYFQYSPTSVHGSLRRSSSITDPERYLAELLEERQKFGPFVQFFPKIIRILNQEIVRISSLVNQSVLDHERMEYGHPYRSLGQHPSAGAMDVKAWIALQREEDEFVQITTPFQAASMPWHAAPGIATIPVIKRLVRLDIPVDKFPNYNFVGRLLGPRGNSLKRVEASTKCRIYIRGQGSIKDSVKEEKLKDKPGYEHLKEPLHILVEAEFPEEIVDSCLDHAMGILENLLKPVDESMDFYKKQQLKELSILNRILREESPNMIPSMSPNMSQSPNMIPSMSPRMSQSPNMIPSMSPSMSPLNSTAMKRAKTGR